MATATIVQQPALIAIPREHGATAMLLTPFFCAAILLRHVYWQELVMLVAIAIAFAIKDPLVIIARQRWVWKNRHAETDAAIRSASFQMLVLWVCAIALILTGDWRAMLPLFVGGAAFTVLAVAVHLRNQQRSTWFQVASALALSATSIAVCLSAGGSIPIWCWWLWALMALQATAGIFVVHARLDARIAARKGEAAGGTNRTAAFVLQGMLLITAGAFAVVGRFWIAGALAIAGVAYLMDLQRQRHPLALQTSLKSVGQQALTLAIAFALLLIVGLW